MINGIKEECAEWAVAKHSGGGGMLYTLEETGGFRKGEKIMQNRYMVNVSRHGSVTKEQADALLDKLLSFLNSSPTT